MRGRAPGGWEEVFRGACLEADVIEALLSGQGLRVVVQRLDAGMLWPGTVFDECRLYVPEAQAEAARALLAEAPDRP